MLDLFQTTAIIISFYYMYKISIVLENIDLRLRKGDL